MTTLEPEARALIQDPRIYREGNRVRLLAHPPEAVRRMLEAIAGAQRGILLEMYIFDDDDVGRAFADALIERARRGIPVRVMYDSLGSHDTDDAFFDRLQEGGVELLEYHPVRWLAPRRLTIRRRNHRKLLVVDGRVAYVGSMNITRGTRNPKEPGFLDTGLEIEGPVVLDLVKIFGRTWKQERGTNPLAERFPELASIEEGGIPTAALGSERWRSRRSVGRAFLYAIQRARHRVWISNSYFVPAGRFIRALLAARARGADVRVVVPATPDVAGVYYATRAYFDQLLRGGVRVFERHQGVLHAKTAVIDGVWCTVGSYNLDHLSLRHNLELTVIALDHGLARQMEAHCEEHMAGSTEIVLAEWRRRGFGSRVLEWLCYGARFLL